MATLGSMMLSQSAIEEVRSILTSADFYQPAHGEICRAVFYLDKKGSPVDFVTIKNRLTELGRLEEVGGVEYIIQMAESVPTAKNAAYYAGIVADKAKMRRLHSAANEMQRLVGDPETDADEKLQKAEEILERAMVSKSAASFESMLHLAKSLERELDETIESGKAKKGIPTGFPDYDKWLSGLFPGNLYIIAARPAMGKSGLGAEIATKVARSVGPVAFFSLEMTADSVVNRMVCSGAGIDTRRLFSGELDGDEVQSAYDCLNEIRGLPLFVDDDENQTVASMKSKLRRLRGEHGGLALAVIDYIQLIKPSRFMGNRQAEVSEVVRGLKDLAKSVGIPIIGLAQVGREVERRGGNKRPTMADVRESGDIEASADVVTLLYRPDYYKDKSGEQEGLKMDVAEVCEAIIAKQRNGPTGTCLLGFVPAFTRFCQLTADSKESYRDKMRSKKKDE